MSLSGAARSRPSDDVAETGTPALAIDVAESLDALEPLAEEWQQLLESSSANGVFLTWDWVRLWLGVYGRDCPLLVLTARRGPHLVGIAPLMIRRVRRFGVAGPRVLTMIGEARGTLAERFAFIAAPGLEAEVTNAFLRFLTGPMAGRWDYLRFARLQPHTRPTEELLNAVGKMRLPAVVTPDRAALFADLPPSMDEYLAQRSSNFRSQYRSSIRKLDRLGTVELRMAGRDIDVAQAMETLGDLHRRRFDAGASASFRNRNYLTFHNSLAAAFAERGWLWLGILELDGKPIAARYDYVYAGKVWCMQGGWDPEYASARPGTVLTGSVFEWAIGEGLREYDFLCGGEDYKLRWSTGERTLLRLRVFNERTVVGRLMPILLRVRRALRGRRNRSAKAALSAQ